MSDQILHIRTSPHLAKGISTDDIMRNVVYALLPVVAFSVYTFGLDSLITISGSLAACVLTEHYMSKWSGKETTIGDWSAVITGLLLGLTLPPSFPLWMAFTGGVIAIALGKFAFGGLGYNVFNPALVGRAVLQAAFPVAITTWTDPMAPDRFASVSSSVLALPFMEPIVDAVSGATPLAAFKFEKTATETMDLIMGFTSGSAGETSTLIIIAGGLYLIARNMMNWRIPAGMLGAVALLSAIFYWINPEIYPTPSFMLFSGGLMLGAIYMATDMVASPMNPMAAFMYGAVIGLVVYVIRIWGGLPEGVMYAILLGNALSPHIDNIFKQRVYGTGLKKKE